MDFTVGTQLMSYIACMSDLKFDRCTLFIISVTGQFSIIATMKYDDTKQFR